MFLILQLAPLLSASSISGLSHSVHVDAEWNDTVNFVDVFGNVAAAHIKYRMNRHYDDCIDMQICIFRFVG